MQHGDMSLLLKLVRLTMWRLALMFVVCQVLLVGSLAQTLPSQFDEFLRAGEKQEIPWKVSLSSPYLSYRQRIQINMRVWVRADDLLGKGKKHDLAFVVRMQKATTGEVLGQLLLSAPALEGMPRRGQVRLTPERTVEFFVPVLVLPGQYTVRFLLWDRNTGLTSSTERRVQVSPLQRDPLPLVWRGLVPVEFMPPAGALDLDTQYGADTLKPLPLEIRTKAHIHIQLVANYNNPALFLPILRVLSEMQLTNGTIRVTVLNTNRAEPIFEQTDGRKLNWPRLRQELDGITTNGFASTCVIKCPVSAARFLHGFLVSRVLEPDKGTRLGHAESSPTEDRSLHVMILLTQPVQFARGWKKSISSLEKDLPENFRLYYMVFPPNSADPWTHRTITRPRIKDYFNDLARIVEQFDPRTYMLQTPEAMRQAIAAMVEDIHQWDAEHEPGTAAKTLCCLLTRGGQE